MSDYNGWHNRETWCVALHLMNTSRNVLDAATAHARRGSAALRSWVEVADLPVLMSDLIPDNVTKTGHNFSAALAPVDWQEVVDALTEWREYDSED